jgi:hypothetical protein
MASLTSLSLASIETVDRVLVEVRTHPNAERLSALCFDVLSGQAEGRALYAGRRVMRVRGAAHRVARSEAETGLGNVMTILERGPERSAEWALIAGFAVRGLDHTIAEGNPAERREQLERFARHADWLELSTPYAPYRFVAELLSETSQDALIEALEGYVLASAEGAASSGGSTGSFRARAALRLSVLASLSRPPARVVLARVVENTQDSWVKALAQHALGTEPVPHTDGFELKGAWGVVPRFSASRLVQYFTGIALVAAVLRFIAFGLGLERTGKVRLESGAVCVHRETRLFGRTLRVSDASYALRDIECAMREVSAPAFQVVFGALSLAAGIVLGIVWISDAIARGDSSLFGSALIAICAGAGLDLLFTGWGRLRRERAGFEMFVDNQRVVALRKVDSERAQRLVEQIARRKS